MRLDEHGRLGFVLGVAAFGARRRRERVWTAMAGRGGVGRCQTVVITGSTRGLGYALAEEYLRRGDRVVVSSRSAERVARAVGTLRGTVGGSEVEGLACDVRVAEEVERLGEFALDKFGAIDVWINNAALVGARATLPAAAPDALEAVVATNLLGALLGCKVAVEIMAKEGGGDIFNVDGSGSWGNPTPQYAAYGATKRAVPQLMKTLIKENRIAGGSHLKIGVHTISPGMMLTDLLLGDGVSPRGKKIFNFLAEEPETVAENLVPRMKAVKGTGKYIRFLPMYKACLRMAAGFLLGQRRNRFFDRDGNRIQASGYRYNSKGVRLVDWDMRNDDNDKN